MVGVFHDIMTSLGNALKTINEYRWRTKLPEGRSTTHELFVYSDVITLLYKFVESFDYMATPKKPFPPSLGVVINSKCTMTVSNSACMFEQTVLLKVFQELCYRR